MMCGVQTNVVTAVEIFEQHTHDAVPFPDLVDTTAENFKINDVVADKAYLSQYNLNVVEQHGGVALIPFKNNSKSGTSGLWTKMYHYFHLHRDEFSKRYHKRSNVEATFSMIKRKFGDSVRSKTQTAQVNECLAKIICHNICCLIHESRELGIDIDLAQKIEPL